MQGGIDDFSHLFVGEWRAEEEALHFGAVFAQKKFELFALLDTLCKNGNIQRLAQDQGRAYDCGARWIAA